MWEQQRAITNDKWSFRPRRLIRDCTTFRSAATDTRFCTWQAINLMQSPAYSQSLISRSNMSVQFQVSGWHYKTRHGLMMRIMIEQADIFLPLSYPRFIIYPICLLHANCRPFSIHSFGVFSFEFTQFQKCAHFHFSAFVENPFCCSVLFSHCVIFLNKSTCTAWAHGDCAAGMLTDTQCILYANIQAYTDLCQTNGDAWHIIE